MTPMTDTFIAIPLPDEVEISCNLCDHAIPDEDEIYYVRVRDAAFVCRRCFVDDPEKEPI